MYEDERLVSGKHGVRFVKNRNKKGGSSSNRFRRRRGEQARDAYDRACALAEEVLAPEAKLDDFVLAGDRIGLEQVIERSRLLTSLTADAQTLPIHVPEVRRALLEGLGRELWSSSVELQPTCRPPAARNASANSRIVSATRSATALPSIARTFSAFSSPAREWL